MKSHQQHFNIVQNRNPISAKTLCNMEIPSALNIVQNGNPISIETLFKMEIPSVPPKMPVMYKSYLCYVSRIREWGIPVKRHETLNEFQWHSAILSTHWSWDKMAAISQATLSIVNENDRISIKISLKFVLKDPINNIPALVQIMAWRRPGNKPLSEPMMVSLLMHICVIRPQWVKYCVNGNHTSTEILCRMKSHQQHFNIVQNINPISTKTLCNMEMQSAFNIVQNGNPISIKHCAKWKSISTETLCKMEIPSVPPKMPVMYKSYLCYVCRIREWGIPVKRHETLNKFQWHSVILLSIKYVLCGVKCFKPLSSPPGSVFIKPDQLDPWIKDQIGNTLLSTILHLQLPNFVSCGRDKPSHMTQNLVTVGVKL